MHWASSLPNGWLTEGAAISACLAGPAGGDLIGVLPYSCFQFPLNPNESFLMVALLKECTLSQEQW